MFLYPLLIDGCTIAVVFLQVAYKLAYYHLHAHTEKIVVYESCSTKAPKGSLPNPTQDTGLGPGVPNPTRCAHYTRADLGFGFGVQDTLGLYI